MWKEVNFIWWFQCKTYAECNFKCDNQAFMINMLFTKRPLSLSTSCLHSLDFVFDCCEFLLLYFLRNYTVGWEIKHLFLSFLGNRQTVVPQFREWPWETCPRPLATGNSFSGRLPIIGNNMQFDCSHWSHGVSVYDYLTTIYKFELLYINSPSFNVPDFWYMKQLTIKFNIY